MLTNLTTDISNRDLNGQPPIRKKWQPALLSLACHRLSVFQRSSRATLGAKWRRRLAYLLVAMAAPLFFAPDFLAASDRNSPAPPEAAAKSPEQRSIVEEFYRERAARNPTDLVALEGMAMLEARRGDYADAINAYQQALELAPDDRDATVGLARTLALDGQFNTALASYQRMLRERAEDTDALEGIARVYVWAGCPSAALPILQDLAERYPANPEYALDLARLEMRLGRNPEAREILGVALTSHPQDREAQLQLAYLDIREDRQADALVRFNRLIARDPKDRDALRGNALVAYHRGDLQYAHNLAAKLEEDDPLNTSTLLLLANLERALHNTRKAEALLDRVGALNPRNDEARDLASAIHDESRITLHTSASFAREISSGDPSTTEDLRAFGYETTLGFSALRRSDSYVSLYYLPSNSPSGGVEGAVGPSEFLYRQTTYLTPRITLRGGVGLTRFGPGELAGISTAEEPIRTAGFRPLGFINLSYALRKKLTLNLTAARSALAYTPMAVRLGVMEDRASAGLNYRFNSRTELNLDSFLSTSSTLVYDHVLIDNGQTEAVRHEADYNRARGASFTFNRNIFRKRLGALDVGYSGLLYGFLGGPQKPFLGFFNPDFYQRHYVTTHIHGKLHGPLGYDFSSGVGVQQIEHDGALTRALLLSPGLTLRTGPHTVVTLGYTHYNSAQSLGVLSGNAVRLTTDWKF